MNPMGVVLLGVGNSGKSAAASALATRLIIELLDYDDMYERRFGESVLVTRDRNRQIADSQRDQIIQEILTQMPRAPSVVVLGAANYLRQRPELIQKIKRTHMFILLEVPLHRITERASAHGGDFNPSLRFRGDRQGIRAFYEKRKLEFGPDYLKWADAIIEPEHTWDVERVALEVCAVWFREVARRSAGATEDLAHAGL